MSLQIIDADWLLSALQLPIKQAQLGYDRETGRIVSTDSIITCEANSTADGTWILTPGLMNAHTHLDLYRANPIEMTKQQSFADWILAVVAWAKGRSPDERLQDCHQSIRAMLATGTTCVADISRDGLSLTALEQVGMRGIVSLECFYPDTQNPTPDVSPTVEFWRTLSQRYAQHPLLGVGLSPHSPYNVSPQAVRALLDGTDPPLIHMHLAETTAECAWIAGQPSALDAIHQTVLGRTYRPQPPVGSPVQYILDALDHRWLLAHGVHIQPDEWALLAERGVSLAHCPRSNHWLGEIPWPQLLPDGIAVGLGTDSALSCPTLDLRDECRAVMANTVCSAQTAFELATAGGAVAIKQGEHLGQLKPGCKADMVLWHCPHTDIVDPYAAWLHPDTQAMTVWINGRVVLEKAV